jgi:putative chitinase
MIPVDAEVMLEIAPRFSGKRAEAQAAITREVGELLAATLESFDISTRLRIAHFLAQTCHETAGFRTTEEFATGQASEGRIDLGNTKPGDGRRFKGRGFLQLTGRANYRQFGAALGMDLESDPELAAEPGTSLRIACVYWRLHKINPLCDSDDLLGVTKAINGGLNGLDDRRQLTTKAKAAVARLEALQVGGTTPVDPARPVLRRGSRGEAVAVLQRMLRQLSFPIAVDGDFGPATELAVVQFQGEHDLTTDGIVIPKTWESLDGVLRDEGSARLG